MAFCGKCGTGIAEGKEFCQRCGEPIDPRLLPENRYEDSKTTKEALDRMYGRTEYTEPSWDCLICDEKGNTGKECKSCGSSNPVYIRQEYEEARIQKEREDKLSRMRLYGVYDERDAKIMQLRAMNKEDAKKLVHCVI